ncbi:MAG: hypothetical protein FD126_3415 [Elusimicrobia bacterium]|nr:MAG: hypothetical protein FD126_3415 [Elusimicrobiota bacterium]
MARGYYRLELLQLTLLAQASGKRLLDLRTARTKDGKTLRQLAEAAKTPYDDVLDRAERLAAEAEERERGLMFRSTMGPLDGMLFVFDDEGGFSFWMKNTFVDLDMLWLDRAGKVSVVHANVPRSRPGMGDDEVATRGGHGLYVLELAAGQAAARKVVAGSVLELALPGARR